MAVQLTGIVAPGTPMALGADRPRGTTAREAPQVGSGAALHGIMDQEVSAVSEAGRPRGVAAPGAPPDGGAAQSPGAAAPALSTELTAARGDGDGDERQPAGSLPTQKPKRKTQNCLRR